MHYNVVYQIAIPNISSKSVLSCLEKCTHHQVGGAGSLCAGGENTCQKIYIIGEKIVSC